MKDYHVEKPSWLNMKPFLQRKVKLQKDTVHFLQIWLLISKFCPTKIMVRLKTFLEKKDDSLTIN